MGVWECGSEEAVMYNNNYSHNANEPMVFGLGASAWKSIALQLWENLSLRRGLIFGLILIVALGAFELFNFSTTDFALTDLLGDLKFAGLRWATILAIAFCGIDFAGLARLFTPERDGSHSLETWYLLGAWFLGATMNAMMTWWAVSLAMVTHEFGNEILSREQLLAYVPVFVAALVWVTRILIIGTFSVAGERLFSQAESILLEARKAATARPAPKPAPYPLAASRHASRPRARVIGGGMADDEDDPFVERSETRPRPATPALSFRPATRPAPKPTTYRPTQPLNTERPHRS